LYNWRFLANFAAIKKLFSENLSTRFILVLDATFLPNLTFLGLLSPDISFGEKKQSPRRPIDFAIRELQCSALRVNSEHYTRL